jgi:hypothetical protein
VHAQHAEPSQFRSELWRQTARPPCVDDDRQKAPANPVANRRTDQLLLAGELGGKAERIID